MKTRTAESVKSRIRPFIEKNFFLFSFLGIASFCMEAVAADTQNYVNIPDSDIVRTGSWENYGTWHSNQPGDWVEVNFEGPAIRWNGFKYDDSGRAAVEIDGLPVDTIDQYDSQRDTPFVWEKIDLFEGRHTLKMSILDTPNQASNGTWVNFINFQAYSGVSVAPEEDIVRTGEWGHYTVWSCNQPGAYVEVTFEGTGIRWKGFKYDDAGRADIELDGVRIDVADQWDVVRDSPFVWEKTGLDYGRHTLRITVSESKNEQSGGNWINYDYFEIEHKNITGISEVASHRIFVYADKLFLQDYRGNFITLIVSDLTGRISSQEVIPVYGDSEIQLPVTGNISRIIVVLDEKGEKIFSKKELNRKY